MDIFEGHDLLITVWRWGRPSTVWPEGPRSVELRVGEAEGERAWGWGQGAGRFDAGKDAGEGLRESQKGFCPQCSGLEWQEPNPNSFQRQRNLLTHESEKARVGFPPGAAGLRVRGCPHLSMPLQLFISSLCQAGSTRPTGGSLAAAAPVPRAQV